MPGLEWSGRPQQKRRDHYTCLGRMALADVRRPMSDLTAGPVFLRSGVPENFPDLLKFSPGPGINA